MADYENFLIIFAYILILNFFFNKLVVLKDKKNLSLHKRFTNTELKPPFSGGILLLITILVFFPNENLQFKIFVLLIFFIGFFSDLNILKSPNLRILIQFIVVLSFVLYSENFIQSVRIEFLDKLFENYIIKLLFTSFCILILINGSNFIDGVNTLNIGYYLLVLIFTSFVLNDFQIQQNNSNLLNILLFTLFLLFILNFFELLYENLFSIIRKINNKKSAYNPDNHHLHHLILIHLKKRLKNTKLANSLTGCSINTYNLIIFYFATINYSNTKHQLLLSFFSLIIYNVLYITLKKNHKKFIN